MIRIGFLLMTVLFIKILPAQHHHHGDRTPYSSFTDRPVKALSESELKGYHNGRGMGMALAAELNGYPGPKHVLELADSLNLKPEQQKKIRQSYDHMHEQAVNLGRRIIQHERRLDSLFASQNIDAGALERLTGKIADLKGRLRLTHLSAHLEMKSVLSRRQVKRYQMLRGYHDRHGNH